MQHQNQAIAPRGGVETAALFFLSLAIVGYMAQAFIVMFAGAIEAATGAPVQVLLVFIATGLIMTRPETLRWLLLGPGRETLGFSLLVLLLVIYYDTSGWRLGLRQYLKSLQMITGLLLYIVTFIICRREQNVRTILQVWFVMNTATATVSAMEFALGIAVPWSVYEGSLRHVGAGLEYSPVPFAYSIAAPTATAAVIVLARARPYADPGRLLCIITMMAGAAGMVSSASRSGLLGVIAGTGIGLVLLGRERRTIPIMTLGGVAAGLAVLTGITRYVAKGGVKGDQRLYDTWAAYFPIALTNPLGAGPGTTTQDRIALLKQAEILLSIKVDPIVATRAFAIAPHNAWLTAGLSFGWVGLFCLFAIYALVLLRGLFVLAQGFRLERGEKVLMTALIGGHISFICHSGFHNSSIFGGEMRAFMVLALITSVSVTLSERIRARTHKAAEERRKELIEMSAPDVEVGEPLHSH